MAIKKLNNSRWIVYGRKGYWPDEPTRTREYFHGEDAEDLARLRDNQLSKPKTPKKAISLTVLQVIRAYRSAKRGETEISTRKSSYYKFRHLVKALGNCDAALITHSDLHDYVNTRLEAKIEAITGSRSAPKKKVLLDRDGNPRTVKRTTVRREISDIKAAFSWALGAGVLQSNPIDKFPLPKKDDDVILPPTPDETDRLIAVAPPHLKRALLISYYTGLRPGVRELLQMRWEQFDPKNRRLLVISARKGGPTSRVVPIMDDEFLAEMNRWCEEDAKAGHIYVIHYSKDPSKKGGPVSSIKTAWKLAKKRAGITRRLRPYDMRHNFATALLSHGADLRSVSEILGHSRPDTTSRIYQHTDTETHRAAISKLPSLGNTCITSNTKKDDETDV